jgi:hypothetical protein
MMSVASVSSAQRNNQFRGFWSGTLSPDMLFGVPEAHVERLSTPVRFELRIFNRGRAELNFLSTNEDEWNFDGKELLLTEIGENGVILGRFKANADNSQNGFSLNLTKIDDQTLLVAWSKISTRATLRFDGLDQIAFAGTDELELTGGD